LSIGSFFSHKGHLVLIINLKIRIPCNNNFHLEFLIFSINLMFEEIEVTQLCQWYVILMVIDIVITYLFLKVYWFQYQPAVKDYPMKLKHKNVLRLVNEICYH